jgi:uncharacterized membrane protein YkgB
MNRLIVGFSGREMQQRLEAVLTRLLARYSMPLLRISLGLVFLGFGLLKFVPGLSPAEDLAQDTMGKLTLGFIPNDIGLVLVAVLETAIGLCLVTGRYLRVGVGLLGLAMIGVLSPLVLFPDLLFGRRFHAPTLEGQYVLKDLVLLAAALVVAAGAQGGRIVTDDEQAVEDRSGETERHRP